MSKQIALEEDPEGLPDFTLPVAIVAQLIGSLAVDIVAQSIGNLKVDIVAQSLTQLNVAVVASSVTLDVNIKSQSANVNVAVVAQSVDLKITNAVDAYGNPIPLKIDIAAQSITLEVNIKSQSVTLDVNIKASSTTLNVNISGATATVNVNISAQSVTLSTSIADALAQLSHTMLLLKGNRVITNWYVYNGSVTIYTVPSGKTAFIIGIAYFGFNQSSTSVENGAIFLVSGSTSYAILFAKIKPSDYIWGYVGTGVIKMNAFESLQIVTDPDVGFGAAVIIMEV